MLIKINDDHFLFGPRFSSPKLHHAIFHEFKLTSNRMLRGGQRRIYIVYSGFADVPPVKFRGILFPINWTVAFNYSNRIIFAKTIIDHNNFRVWPGLGQNRLNRRPNIFATVVAGN